MKTRHGLQHDKPAAGAWLNVIAESEPKPARLFLGFLAPTLF